MLTKAGLGSLGSATENILGLGNLLTGGNLPSRVPFLANLEEAGKVAERIFGEGSTQPGALPIVGKFPEQVLSKILENLPITLATGGANIPLALAKDVAGSVAQTSAENLGLPKGVQFFAGLAGERGLNKALEKLGKKVPAKYLPEIAKEAENTFYNEAKTLGEKIKSPAIKYKKGLQEIGQQLSDDSALSISEKKELIDKINIYLRDLNKGYVTGKDLINRRGEINSLIGGSKGKLNYYYQGLKKNLGQELASQEGLHKAFGKKLADADAVHGARNFSGPFTEYVNSNPGVTKKILSNPLSYAVAALGTSLYMGKDPIEAATNAALAATVTGGAKKALDIGALKADQILGFAREEAPRKLLLKASEDILKRNFGAATRTYNKLNNLADKYMQQDKKYQEKRQKYIDSSRKNLVAIS